MTISKTKKSMLLASMLATAVVFSGMSYAGGNRTPLVQKLTGADTLLTTYVSKSKISGALEKDAGGNLVFENGHFNFDFAGDIYYPITSPLNGKLLATSGPIGTVSGSVAFPYEFANLAFAVYGWLMNGAVPADMPAIPSVINWTMNDITIVDAGTTYVPIPNNPDMELKGRAFTGLGPVEIGQLLNGNDGLSMSVRMGGCFGVQAVSGTEAGKIGTYCLNSTFTFDLSGINLANPLQSTITGTGTSNCFTVLQTPIM